MKTLIPLFVAIGLVLTARAFVRSAGTHLLAPRSASVPKPNQSEPGYAPGFPTSDLIMMEEQRLYLEGGEVARQVIKDMTKRWPHHEVPYVIAKGDFTREQEEIIQKSIIEFNRKVEGCVQFVQRKDQQDYLYIRNNDGCYSNLGRVGGKQILSLDSNGCLYQGTILHQLMYSLGFIKTHTRSDRDHYVEILWDNIPEAWHSEYAKVEEEGLLNPCPYDYYSIMHYPADHAPDSDLPAMDIKMPGIDGHRVGYGDNLTLLDINCVSFAFKPLRIFEQQFLQLPMGTKTLTANPDHAVKLFTMMKQEEVKTSLEEFVKEFTKLKNTLELFRKIGGNFVLSSVQRCYSEILAFHWNLTACEFFEVRRSLLLSIAEASFSYFIFMFQLRGMERDESSQQHG